MIKSKRYIIATCLFLALPLTGWSEAPVVDDSENFAMMEEQQDAQAPVVDSKYGESSQGRPQSRNNEFAADGPQDDGPALAQEDNTADYNTGSNPGTSAKFNDNAKLIEKVQSLQQEIQELRGQLEVQAHDLKLLQQQQIAFYKDLDTRLGASSGKSASNKPSADLSMDLKNTASVASIPAAIPKAAPVKKIKVAQAVQPAIHVSRTNPADEQISYLAAYELVKNKHYDEAITAMETFSRKYPQGGYTANAEYWLGELYMVKKEYPKAIAHFEVVLNQFPSSSKSAASMLKSGYAFAYSGNNQEAIKRLGQLVKTYPDSPSAELAKTKLESIKSV
ncbi:MAG: tol-pal system protein YbgF [Legionellales bacterium]